MHIGADLCATSDRGPGVDHRVGPYTRPDVHITRHHDHTAIEKRSVTSRCTGNNAHTRCGKVTLQRNLVGVFKRCQFNRGHLRKAEVQKNGVLQPLMNDGLSVGPQFSNPGLARIEQRNCLPDSSYRVAIGRAQSVSVVPEFVNCRSKISHSGRGYRPTRCDLTCVLSPALLAESMRPNPQPHWLKELRDVDQPVQDARLIAQRQRE
ncbi:unannotated protein [freshwater metagenome]|uniref:Unannotated protein n=1 Tax=freshwater metagenome TaxID=449393 RepID=A0A6J7L9I2_9ZZZZ